MTWILAQAAPPGACCQTVRVPPWSGSGGDRVAVAAAQFTALALIVSGHRWALAASYLAGAGLVLWIAVQMLVLQRYFILQPAIAGAGAAEMLLARLWQRAQAAPGGLPAVPLTDSASGSRRRQ